MAKKSSKQKSIKIPEDQLDLPVTVDAAGNFMTLREVMKQDGAAALSLASLTPEKRAELTVKRIEAQPKFELAMVGGGVVDKTRAIEEVKAHSEIGKVLAEIEQRVVQSLLDAVQSV